MILKLEKSIKLNKILAVNKKFFLLFNYFTKVIFSSLMYKFIYLLFSVKNNYFIANVNLKYLCLFNNTDKGLLLLFCNYLHSKIFIKVGLGFRKKYSKKYNTFVLNIGRRYLVLIKPMFSTYFFNIRRRSIYIYSNTKKNVYMYLSRLRILRKETVYKYKGIMTSNRLIFDMKMARSIVFARRVKFRSIRLKLTRKQKQRK